MEKTYQVTFQKSESIYCVNMIAAGSIEDVQKHYSKYKWLDVREATDYDVENAMRRHMLIIAL